MRLRLPRRPLTRARRALAKVLGLKRPAAPASRAERVRVNKARHGRDLRRLKALAERRPELQLRITCAGKNDGVGAQALAVISALAFAASNNCRYLHTPFRTIAHAEGDPVSWAARWEAFLGLGHGETAVPDDALLAPLRQFVRAHRRDPSRMDDPRTVVRAPHFSAAGVQDADAYQRLMPKLRAKYYSSDKSALPLFREEDAITVAVHVRRGDIAAGRRRYIPDAPILNTIAGLRSVIGSIGRKAHINIFSQGTADMFRPYRDAGCHVHLDTDPFVSFHNLVTADVLVAAPSSFSHLAALLGDGAVVKPTGNLSASGRWIGRSADGQLDRAKLVDFLAARAVT